MLKHHPTLMQQLQRLAGEALTADAHGNCLIEIDDVQIILKSRENTLVVQAVLGSFLADHSVEFWRKLMELNAPLIEADRGAIGIVDDDDDTIVLVANIDTTRLHEDVVSETLSTVVEQARQLIKLLNQELPTPMAKQDVPSHAERDLTPALPSSARLSISLA